MIVNLTLVLGSAAVLAVLVLFFVDKTQSREPIRRRYPVLVWGRKTLVAMGPLLRQYLFMGDRDETPYDRITRNWVHQTSQGQRNTIGFGTQTEMSQIGSIVFLPATFTNQATHTGEQVGGALGRLIGGRGNAPPVMMPHFLYISGMSYGGISRRAVQSLNRGAGKAGIFHNIGEGGLAEAHKEGGDVIFQIGTAKYGVGDEKRRLVDSLLAEVAAQDHVKMFEVKLAQGAKPGKGGMLLKEKITPEIAAMRKIPLGQDAYSPPRHEEFNDVHGLFDFIDRVREVARKPVGIKVVIGHPEEIESIAAKMAEDPNRGPDFITVDGGEGGTGAAPLVLASYAGLPLRQALSITDQVLKKHGVRDAVSLFASGKIATPADAGVAMALGADAVGIARGFLFALGCIQALECHSGHCPVGIATPNERAQRAIDVEGASERVATYARTLIKETQMLAESCGYADPANISPFDVMVHVEPGRFEYLANIAAVGKSAPATH